MRDNNMVGKIKRDWCNDEVDLAVRMPDIFQTRPRLGIVIGTYASLPYIHLQLEARLRLYPDIPCLVHDDASDDCAKLRELCRKYDCHFEHNTERHGHQVGDLSVFVGGLLWAREMGIELLLKLSRRWVFLEDWSISLCELAMASQYATFSNYTTSWNFGFRTECVGLAVSQWSSPIFIDPAIGRINAGECDLIEAYIHNFARGFERSNSVAAERWRHSHPMPSDKNGYAQWDLIGTDRCTPCGAFLWHHSAAPQEYFRLSQKWKLPYGFDDFKIPSSSALIPMGNKK